MTSGDRLIKLHSWTYWRVQCCLPWWCCRNWHWSWASRHGWRRTCVRPVPMQTPWCYLQHTTLN